MLMGRWWDYAGEYTRCSLATQVCHTLHDSCELNELTLMRLAASREAGGGQQLGGGRCFFVDQVAVGRGFTKEM